MTSAPTGIDDANAGEYRHLSRVYCLLSAHLRRLTQTTGWRLTTYDDAECRFFALASREQPGYYECTTVRTSSSRG
jgi:hypothetical protein